MKKKMMKKEEIAEDYCFICKDGGHLRVCDFKNCLKAYHPHCVSKDQTFLETDERWTCGWHSCFICHKVSAFQCFCCPSSICRGCIRAAEFVQTKKRTKGFCNNCLKLTILIEENIDVDSDGGKVDFQDTATYEFLFKEYWDIIKQQEGLTLADLHAADMLLKNGENCKSGSDSDRLSEEELMTEADDIDDACDNGKRKHRGKKVLTPIPKTATRKKTFIGWGSEELIRFLESIGKNTKEPLPQLDISEIIKDYIHANNLFDPDKKKKKIVICDERLYSLFRKKKLKLYKIHNLLENHIAANADSDDEISFSSDEGNQLGSRKRERINSNSKVTVEPNHCRRKVQELPKSVYAALVDKNINPLYMRKALVLKLLKDPETFENKVKGCFVRVKTDPKDFFYVPNKNYELGQVKGIKKAPQPYKIGEESIDIVLCLSNIWKDIRISMLSDDDIEEEEIEDLRNLVKKGLFKKPTIVELEEKIKRVHEDIMNHWIDRQIVRLQRLIVRANDKGWRAEKHMYIDERELLCTSNERIRLLKEIPSVIADMEEEVDLIASTGLNNHGEYSDRNTDGADAPVKEVEGLADGLEDTIRKDEGGHAVEASAQGVEDGHAASVKAMFEGIEGGSGAAVESLIQKAEGKEATPYVLAAEKVIGASSDLPTNLGSEIEQPKTSGADVVISNKVFLEIEEDDVVPRNRVASEIPIIDLDSDDDGKVPSNSIQVNDSVEIVEVLRPESHRVWHYVDPSGKEQGPFALESLRLWSKEGFFNADFKVWRAGQSRADAVFLAVALGVESS